MLKWMDYLHKYLADFNLNQLIPLKRNQGPVPTEETVQTVL